MTTRARWSTPSASRPQGDLLDGPVGKATPAVVGIPLSLASKTDEQESAQILELMNREDELTAAGITCSIRDSSETCCLACPISQHQNPQDPLSALCRVGREQDKVFTESVVRNELKKRRAADHADS